MPIPCPRLAVRALILQADRLLIVNAFPGDQSDLWCAPGGGVERGHSLPDNLIREVFEETGLRIRVDAPVLVNEFHDPQGSFHQVDIYFRCRVVTGQTSADWRDPAGVVSRHRWVTQQELMQLRFKPDSLPHAAWPASPTPIYDPLEPIVR